MLAYEARQHIGHTRLKWNILNLEKISKTFFFSTCAEKDIDSSGWRFFYYGRNNKWHLSRTWWFFFCSSVAHTHTQHSHLSFSLRLFFFQRIITLATTTSVFRDIEEWLEEMVVYRNDASLIIISIKAVKWFFNTI